MKTDMSAGNHSTRMQKPTLHCSVRDRDNHWAHKSVRALNQEQLGKELGSLIICHGIDSGNLDFKVLQHQVAPPVAEYLKPKR